MNNCSFRYHLATEHDCIKLISVAALLCIRINLYLFCCQEIYRIRLPGKPTEVGEGKPNNQNHAIIFTRGEALQAIDMNQVR